MFVVPEDFGTPEGAVTLRGAWDFRTPAGWDTIYTPIFSLVERPAPSMLAARRGRNDGPHGVEDARADAAGERLL